MAPDNPDNPDNPVPDITVPTPNSCENPEYSVTIKGNRYLKAKDLKKGLLLTASSSHKSKAKIKVSIRKSDLKRLKLKGKTTVGRKNVKVTQTKETNVKVKLSSKLRKALLKKRVKVLRLKVVVVSSATGVPEWRKLERRASISTFVKIKGKLSKKESMKKVTSTKKVEGISPCAQRLKVKVKPEKRGSVKEGLRVSFQSNSDVTVKLKLTLREKDVNRLKLSKRRAKKIFASNVRLIKDKNTTKKLRISGKARSLLLRQMKRKKVKRIKVKLVFNLKGSDGQRVRRSVTVRLKRQ